jgi:hypothetical protein
MRGEKTPWILRTFYTSDANTKVPVILAKFFAIHSRADGSARLFQNTPVGQDAWAGPEGRKMAARGASPGFEILKKEL